MAFTAKLPTFHVPATVWKYQAGEGFWLAEVEVLLGQLYTQLRNQDDSSQGTLYFMYPKEDDLLRDRLDYDEGGLTDVLLFAYPEPAPRTIGYRVRDVQPRWLGFPNEHLMATLDKMTDAEVTVVITSQPPPEPPPEMLVNQVGPGNNACGECISALAGTREGLALITDTPTLKEWREGPIAVTCFPDGVYYTIAYFVTSGLVVLSIDSPVGVSLAAYSATVPGWDYTLTELAVIYAEDVECSWGSLVSVGVDDV